jgi:hypothetical protein
MAVLVLVLDVVVVGVNDAVVVQGCTVAIVVVFVGVGGEAMIVVAHEVARETVELPFGASAKPRLASRQRPLCCL